ncbi:MAG: TonB-dependent receptor plug domain-containing protein, partial [Bacteroidales bacterium]|nr:TonB-dependent receptor plug domain-containing protein [Bacteroidales bacterium]
MTQENILAMSFDELSAYPLEDIVKISELVGIPIDDLFNMLLNKDVAIASKRDESYFDTPLSTSVLTAEDIQRSGALSIPEVLRLLPGVIVREKTNGNYDVHIRGSNNIAGQQSLFSENTMTLVMIDGRTVYSFLTGGTFWEALSIGVSDIERIEVIRGAASAMYGANAVTGVINIITKKSAGDRVCIEANTSLGGIFNGASPVNGRGAGHQSLSLLNNVNEKFKYRISGNYNYRDRAQSDIFYYLTHPVAADGISARYYPVDSAVIQGMDPEKMFKDSNRGLQSFGVNGLVSYTINENVQFDLTAGIQNSTAISSNLDLYFFAHSERQSALQYVNLQSKIYDFNIHTDYTWGWGNIAGGSPGLRTDQSNFNFDIEYSHQWSRVTISPGLNFSYITNNGESHPENQSYFKGTQVLYSIAPSIRADYKPVEKLRLSGALRLESNKVPEKPYLTWQLLGNYKFNEGSLVRAVYSRANQSPFMLNANSNSSVFMENPMVGNLPVEIRMTGEKDLKLVVADMYELGYRQRIGKRILLNVELFHSQMKNFGMPEPEEMRLQGSLYPLTYNPVLLNY